MCRDMHAHMHACTHTYPSHTSFGQHYHNDLPNCHASLIPKKSHSIKPAKRNVYVSKTCMFNFVSYTSKGRSKCPNVSYRGRIIEQDFWTKTVDLKKKYAEKEPNSRSTLHIALVSLENFKKIVNQLYFNPILL